MGWTSDPPGSRSQLGRTGPRSLFFQHRPCRADQGQPSEARKQTTARGRQRRLPRPGDKRDDQKETGTIELVVAILATHHIDLHYFFKRSDELEIGKAARLLLERLAEIFTGPALETDARTFLVCRERFLKILRTYSKEKS